MSLIAGADQPQNQLDVLIQELGRIEVQQNKLRDAVKHNKGIVVHPRQEVDTHIWFLTLNNDTFNDIDANPIANLLLAGTINDADMTSASCYDNGELKIPCAQYCKRVITWHAGVHLPE